MISGAQGMKEKIKEHFEYNLKRTKNLVKIFHEIRPGVRGKPRQEYVDILRAAVVFLHATLEDLLRSVSKMKIPQTKNEATIKSLPLPENSQITKFSMSDVASYRGESIETFIEMSVATYLERKSYNSSREILTALQKCDFEKSFVDHVGDKYGSVLDAIVSRRHLIVHRTDRNSLGGKGNIRVADLGSATVDSWINVVEELRREIIDRL
jgi:hypothetical protein